MSSFGEILQGEWGRWNVPSWRLFMGIRKLFPAWNQRWHQVTYTCQLHTQTCDMTFRKATQCTPLAPPQPGKETLMGTIPLQKQINFKKSSSANTGEQEE